MPTSLSELDAAIVKGMLKRGDKQHDIAAHFGVNPGRVMEIKNGSRYGKITATPDDKLPPRGSVRRIALELIDPEAPLAEQIDALRLLILTTPPGSPGIIVRFSPALAGYILENLNLGNRQFRPAKIKQLKEAINRGWWDVTGDTIKFGAFSDEDLAKGLGLRDGQNRLSAIAQAGKIVASYAVFGINPTAFTKIDAGAGRSATDTFLTYGVTNAGVVSGATRWLKIFELNKPPEQPNRGLSLTNDEVWDFYKTKINAERIQYCAKIAKGVGHRVLPANSLAALLYIFNGRDKSCAELLVQDIEKGMRGGGRIIDRARKLKDIRLSRVHENEYIATIILGWNEYRAGRTRFGQQVLVWDIEKPFPAIA